jgi:hypothetical protein
MPALITLENDYENKINMLHVIFDNRTVHKAIKALCIRLHKIMLWIRSSVSYIKTDITKEYA